MDYFDLAFTILPIAFGVIFLGVFTVCAILGIRLAREWKRRDNLPRVTVPATVAARRTTVKHFRRNRGFQRRYNQHTEYFITFQLENGDRVELPVLDWQYGTILEGDTGKLTFQGIRFLNFEWNKEDTL